MKQNIENIYMYSNTSTSSDSRTPYMKNASTLPKQRALPFLKSDDSSNELTLSFKHPQSIRREKYTNNDQLDTDISTSILPV